jgi:hypothetical protein
MQTIINHPWYQLEIPSCYETHIAVSCRQVLSFVERHSDIYLWFTDANLYLDSKLKYYTQNTPSIVFTKSTDAFWFELIDRNVRPVIIPDLSNLGLSSTRWTSVGSRLVCLLEEGHFEDRAATFSDSVSSLTTEPVGFRLRCPTYHLAMLVSSIYALFHSESFIQQSLHFQRRRPPVAPSR